MSALATGSRLGSYEIVASLGAGGMGEVYRARDLTLGREVAIKILTEQTPESLARFDREARAVAALSHPNIPAVHHFGRDGDRAYIVTELLDGQSLREHIDGGPLSWRVALDIAIQICDALAAAHGHGITHRDLKPDNIFITSNGRAKVLDFGLARVDSTAAGSESASTAFRTRSGMVMGTLPYMAPEQLRGENSGPTADLFSLGCVLHEMITGQSPFRRESQSDTITAVLRDEPPELRGVPPQLAAIVERCLAKEKERRFHSASDLQFDLQQIVGKRPARTPSRIRRLALSAAVVLIALIALLWIWSDDRKTSSRATEGAQNRGVALRQVTSAKGIEQFPAWSPDGSQIVFSRESGPRRKLYLRSLRDGAETPLTTGDADEIQPAWSPDGRTILFVRPSDPGARLEPADPFDFYDFGDIWSIDLATKTEAKLISRAFNPAWSRDGKQIAFDAPWSGPRRIWTADPRGHNPQQITTDVSEAVVHIRPRWSPDGMKIVFQNVDRTQFDVRVADLATKQLTWITNDALADVEPVWSPSGRYIYFVSARGGGYNIWRVAVDNAGKPRAAAEQITTGAGQDINLAFSSDGKRCAFAILWQNADLWRLPVSPATGGVTGAPEELVATTREDSRGSWSPDMKRIAFNSDRGGDMNIWVKSLEDGSERQITRGPGGDFQATWSPDGRRLVFFSTRAGSMDIWDVAVDGGEPRRLTTGTSSDGNPFYSPDGTRIAYHSDGDGRMEVWVMNADGSAARQLTRAGVMGHFMRWSPDGRSIYFRSPGTGGNLRTLVVSLEGNEPRKVETRGGAHMSFSPDFTRMMDVLDHKTLWVTPMTGGEPVSIFASDDPAVRIDYPTWSPDGKWVLFDRFKPEGGDIWLMENFE